MKPARAVNVLKLARHLAFVTAAVVYLATPKPALANIQCNTGANGCYYDDSSMNYSFQCGWVLAAGIGGCCGAGSGVAMCDDVGGGQWMLVECGGDRWCDCDIYGDYCHQNGDPLPE